MSDDYYVEAVRVKATASIGENLEMFRGHVLSPYELKAGGRWRRVFERGNGVLYLASAEGEKVLPEDLVIVLNNLPKRNAVRNYPGRPARPSKAQALSGNELNEKRRNAANTPKGNRGK